MFSVIFQIIVWRVKLALRCMNVKDYWVVSDFKPETNYCSDIDYDRAKSILDLYRIANRINKSDLRRVIGFEADCY